MVVIHLKRSETDQFLYECSIADSNDKVTRDLVCVLNLVTGRTRAARAFDLFALEKRLSAGSLPCQSIAVLGAQHARTHRSTS